MKAQQFSPKVASHLGYYVYLYINPLDDTVFYVGKGIGNRAFTHLDESGESQKVHTIQAIRAQGKEPRIEILVHGLQDEATALRIEAAVIDLIGVKNLTNKVRGWESGIVGRMATDQLISLYDSEPVDVDDPALLTRINRRYRYGMSGLELYDATRGVWRIGSRREAVRYAFAVYQGIVKEVYRVNAWFPGGTTLYETRDKADVDAPDRWEFTGEVADEAIRSKYVEKSVRHHFSKNAQSPYKYMNC